MKRLLTELDCCCCFIAFLSVIQAIPIQDNRTDFDKAANITQLENVCVHENTIYAEGQNLSTSNPCEICICDPPGFSCSLSSCDLRPGCKAIHKANHCCPEYVCECERNGKTYGNGEKVEEPNPCKVCYCKGGEIKCALVTCYTRDDCEPGYVAGLCCPKYDHCPPLEMMKNKSTTPAPAQVIISDLKTESTPISSQKDIKMTIIHIKDEATEPTTSETFPEEESTPSGFISTEFSDSSSERTEIPTTTFPEMTENNAIFTELDQTPESLNETTEDATTETESTTEFCSSWNDTTATILTTEEYNATSTEILSTTEETTMKWTEGFENQTDEYTLTDPVNTTEDSTTDPGIRLDALKNVATTNTVGDCLFDVFCSTPLYENTTVMADTINSEYSMDFQDLETVNDEHELTTEMTTEATAEEVSKSSVIKVIVPKTMKNDVAQIHNSGDDPAPIVVMISADQIQFLKLAEEPPVYVENPDSGGQKPELDHLGVMVVPKTTPTTVEMVKVIDGPMNATTEGAKSVNISFISNSTDFMQMR